jgi:pSer/pThr/pTyr-binding forkhead associated (FHA) protein
MSGVATGLAAVLVVAKDEAVWFNVPGMRAALVFTRGTSQQKLELSGGAVTIGRGAECELQIADDRISIRHCRLSVHDGAWMIQDLKSTNRTFVNGELLGDRPRQLVHGDSVRLGAHDSRLFEAQFVASERASERRGAPQAPGDALHKKIAELEAALAARDTEVVRLGGMYKHLQGQLSQSEAAAVAARRTTAMMTSEIEALRDELASLRDNQVGCRDEVERARRCCAELEAQLEAQARKARRELDDGNRNRKELESKLSLAASELVITKAALATASDNIRSLKAGEPGRPHRG